MKAAIFSDSHDNLPNIYKALDYIKKQGAEVIIHCGDIAAASVIREMVLNFNGHLYLVQGNVTADQKTLKEYTQDLKNITIIHENFGELKLDGKNIAFTHFPQAARQLAETGKYNFVFYGHTHKPWQEKVGQTQMINPGTLAGLFNKATFALWDTREPEPKLIILETI